MTPPTIASVWDVLEDESERSRSEPLLLPVLLSTMMAAEEPLDAAARRSSWTCSSSS